jgi:membrane associated rhomboid family serine protease
MSRDARDLFEPKLGLTIPLCGLHFIFYFLIQADPARAVGLFGFSASEALLRPWSFVTYQFLHSGMLDLFFGTLMLYILGMALEMEWGTGPYAVFWAISTLGASVAAFVLGQSLASGMVVVNVSMLFAFAYLFPDTQFLILLVVPVKVKWLAFLTAGWLGLRLLVAIPAGTFFGTLVEVLGISAGFLYFWVLHQGRFKARRAGRLAVAAVKTAGAVREDESLARRNRELFPRVEALRSAVREGGAIPPDAEKLRSELPALVVPGVNICKPVDFKGDKDGVCVKCEGFAECSLRYIAGQPGEITVRER